MSSIPYHPQACVVCGRPAKKGTNMCRPCTDKANGSSTPYRPQVCVSCGKLQDPKRRKSMCRHCIRKARKLQKANSKAATVVNPSLYSLKLIPESIFQGDDVITAYTDGSCLRNPGGAGGIGVVLTYTDKPTSKQVRVEISNGYRSTTNNRMEILAAIHALTTIKPGSTVVIYTDSQYLQRSISGNGIGWVYRWIKQGWKLKPGISVKNQDLWKWLLSLVDKNKVKIKWIRSRSGNTENERADYLSKKAYMRNSDLLEDTGYTQLDWV